jgi:hypothetical protein
MEKKMGAEKALDKNFAVETAIIAIEDFAFSSFLLEFGSRASANPFI